MSTPAATAEELAIAPSRGGSGWPGDGVGRRAKAALGAAVLALVAAVVVAVGPADASRGDYRWPDPASSTSAALGPAPADAPTLFTPLLLARHTPSRLSVDVPCAVVQATRPADGKRLTVLQTANELAVSAGLWLVVEGETLRLGVGNTLLAEEPWPVATVDEPACVVSARFRGEEWRFEAEGRELGRGQAAAPVVTALFTQLPRPVTGEPGLSVRVVTEVAGTSPSMRQLAVAVLAMVAGVTALVLLVRRPSGGRHSRSPLRPRAETRRSLRHAFRRLQLTDAVVVVSLAAWWFFGPVLLDDGWVLATVRNYPASGAFSNYYEVFDAQYPLGFVHDLVHFAASGVSTSLLWMRFPVLVVGVATWALLRTYLVSLRGDPMAAGRAPLLALATTFLLVWFAWLSTLRPEPMVALLSVVEVVAIQRFCRTATVGPLVVAALAATVAITLHPVGVIAIAPLLVTGPAIWRWASHDSRVRLSALTALGLAAAATLLLLVMADTDLGRWRENQNLFAASSTHQMTWRDELDRYELLFAAGSAVVRRATVLFSLVAVALFLTRRHRRADMTFDLPVMSLMVGVVLMTLTPSKWHWQLGGLGALAALAVATELYRFGLDPPGSVSRYGRSLLVFGAVVVASVGAWRGGADFGPLGVVTVDFGRGASDFIGIDLSSPLPWLALGSAPLVGCAIVAGARRRFSARRLLDRWLTLVGTWAVPAATGILLATTLSLFVVDTFVSAPAWSLPRQHFDGLFGETCGLADDVGVADAAQGQPLEPDPVPAEYRAATTALPDATRGDPLEFTTDGIPDDPSRVDSDIEPRWGSRVTGDDDTGVFFAPWFVVDPNPKSKGIDGRGLAIFTAGRPNSAGNRLLVQFGRREGGAIHGVQATFVHAPDTALAWQPSELDPPPGADRVRVIAVDTSQGFGGWLAFTAPRVVRYQPLDDVVGRPGVTTLISPFLRFYFPCVTDPRLAGGVAQAPDYIIGYTLLSRSPLAKVFDIYPSTRLLTRTANGTILGDLGIDRIDKRARGIPVPFEH